VYGDYDPNDETSTIGDGTVVNNLIDRYQKDGISVGEKGSNVAVRENTILGVGETLQIAQNGIQVSYGGQATVRLNNLRDNIYTGDQDDDFDAGGILLFRPNVDTLPGSNTVARNDYNIGLFNADGIEVRTNRATNGRDLAGILANARSTDNLFRDNRALNNQQLDYWDKSGGTRTDGTANTWTNNIGEKDGPSRQASAACRKQATQRSAGQQFRSLFFLNCWPAQEVVRESIDLLRTALSDTETVKCVPDRPQVLAAEEIHVNHKRVETVQVTARLVETPVYAPDLRIALQKRPTERVEEADEGQLDLRVRMRQRGVEESGYAIPARQHVRAPHVAVDERWRVRLPDKILQPPGQAFDSTQVFSREASRPVGNVGDVEQSLLSKELGPASGPRVRLIEAADEGVSLVTVGIRRDVVQRCQEFGGVTFGVIGEAAASFYELHQQQRLRTVVDLGDG
jgi:hypothetical protein